MKKSFQNFFCIFSIFAFFSIISCATNHAIIQENSYIEREKNFYIPQNFTWTNIENSDFAEYFFYENKSYPVRYHCVKIDLSKENLRIVTFPKTEEDFVHKNGINKNYFKGLRASEFSKKNATVITVNTAPFGGKNGKWDKIAKITSSRRICGIHVVNNKILSPPIANYSALCFFKDEKGFRAKIIKNQKDEDFSVYDFAFGGFFKILTESKKESFSWRSNDSRTAVGLSKDGKILYILVVEGERYSKSHGLSYPECADIFLALGASEAMQMDGGGSSSLFINGKNSLSYPAFRKNAVFLGFY